MRLLLKARAGRLRALEGRLVRMRQAGGPTPRPCYEPPRAADKVVVLSQRNRIDLAPAAPVH